MKLVFKRIQKYSQFGKLKIGYYYCIQYSEIFIDLREKSEMILTFGEYDLCYA
jgi:hypothetical protein